MKDQIVMFTLTSNVRTSRTDPGTVPLLSES